MRPEPLPLPTAESVSRHPGVGAGWWTAVLSALATAGLLALALVLFSMDVLATGAAAVLDPRWEDLGPAADDYVETAVLGAGVTLLGSALLLALARPTPLGTWPGPAQGLFVATLAGLAGGSTLLIRLGIDPLDFVVTLL